MSRIRFNLRDEFATPAIPAPDQFGITKKRLGRCQLVWIEVFPEAALRFAERGYTTFRRDAGAGQHEHMPRRPERVDNGIRDRHR